MYYLNSRYYNPSWGRFINADGIIGANQDILGYNLYAYVSNNPSMFRDPSGNGLISWLVSLYESIFDYSIKKATKGTNIKVENPIKNKTASKSQKQTTDAIVNVVANSKISYSVGVSVGAGLSYGSVSYGQTIAPNSGINKKHLTIESGASLGVGFPITPTVSFSFQPGLSSPLDLLNDNTYAYYRSSGGRGASANVNAGIGYNLFDPYAISISPSIGVDIGLNYTWEWDR